MFGIGPWELVVIVVVGLLVLGPKRLPEVARSLGKGLAEFRRASSDLRQSLALDDEPARRAPRPGAPAQTAADLPEPTIAPPQGAAPARRAEPTAAAPPAEATAAEGPGPAAAPDGAGDEASPHADRGGDGA